MDIALDEFFELLTNDDRQVYKQIAKGAYELGYKAKKAKTKDINYVFSNSKTKKHLLKFSFTNNKPELKIKFFASKQYSGLFHEGVKNAIEEFNF